jgi:SAM-dependent methyltransferase
MRELRAALSEQGISHVHLAAAWVWFPEDDDLPADPSVLDLDAYFEIPPHWLPSQALQPTPPGLSGEFNGELYDYNRTVTVALAKLDEPIVGLRHRGVMTAWDSTARKGSRAAVFHAATPTSFRRWLRSIIAHERRQQGKRVVFINAWNEWAEGTYLEPDNDFGCGWLEAVASVSDVEWLSTQPPGSLLETGQHRSQSSISSNLDRAELALGDDKTYHLWAKTLSDDEWCNFLAGTGMPRMPRHTPPPLPPEKFQTTWVGNAGIDTFREAMGFCRLLKSTLALADYRLGSDSRLLDIGVGWGRIYRTLLRETPHIIGIDVVPECIELCRSALPGGQFELSPLAPPYRFSDGEFDVAYLYSVFSHLNETLFLAILREAARVVREGGFVVFTTIGPSDEIMQRNGFAETWRADANAGRFLFLPTGGGHESMSPWVWGWAHLSEPYLRRILPDFPLRLVAYEPNRLMQAFVALQKQ